MKMCWKSIGNVQINDLEMTFNDLQMTLRPKTTSPLRAPWKNLQKLSNILSTNSYSSRFIDEDYVLIFVIWTVKLLVLLTRDGRPPFNN